MKYARFWIVLLWFGSIGVLCAQSSTDSVVAPANSSTFIDTLRTSVAGIGQPSVMDSLFYSADSISFVYDTERIYLYGNTSVEYKESTITSDSLFIDLKKEQAFSWGPTRLQDGDQLLIGKNARYDVRSQTGLLDEGRSFIEDGYYNGLEIRKIRDAVFDIDGALFTTCDLEEPSYWFWSKQMRIYQRDKVVGKHVVAYVNHFPIFYFPFITMSIKRGRHPGFLIPEPGYNSTDGKYLKDIAWYYPYKDFADVTLGIDLMEKTGWKANFDTSYIKRYLYQGKLAASYQKNISTSGTTYDWALRGNHHHDLPEKSAVDVSLDFVSNKRIWESSYDLNESLAQRLNSSIAYRKPIGNTYLNAGLLYNQDLINDTASLSLPSASWSLPSRPLYELFRGSSDSWYSNLSYSYNVRLDHYGIMKDTKTPLSDYIWSNTIDPADSTRYINEHHIGMKHAVGLSYSQKYFGWLNVRQGIDYSEAWFDRDRNDKKWVRGNDYSASMNGSFNLYGIRNFEKGKLTSVRHIVTPSIGLNFMPSMKGNADYYSFGSIGLRSSDKQANLSFAIDQKWQGKIGNGKNQIKLNDVFSWTSRIGANLYKKDKPFGNIAHSFAFRPGSFSLGSVTLGNPSVKFDALKLGYSSQLSCTQHVYDISFGDAALKNHYFSQNISLGGNAPYKSYYPATKNTAFSGMSSKQAVATSESLEGSNAWNITLAHDLYASKDIFMPQTQSMRMNASLKITDNLTLAYNNYYDLKQKELISQGIRLSRDLHCWKLDITFNKRNEFWDYRIVFFNTKFPDALRFQTRDSKKY